MGKWCKMLLWPILLPPMCVCDSKELLHVLVFNSRTDENREGRRNVLYRRKSSEDISTSGFPRTDGNGEGNIARLTTRSLVLAGDFTCPEGAVLGNFNRGSDASNLTLARLFKTRPRLR